MYRCLSGIRTGGFTAVQDIHVKFKANQEKIAEEFIDFLNQEYVGIEFELDYVRDYYLAEATESAQGYYYPETRWEPAECDIEFICTEENLLDVCKEFRDKYDDEEIFNFESISCDLE